MKVDLLGTALRRRREVSGGFHCPHLRRGPPRRHPTGPPLHSGSHPFPPTLPCWEVTRGPVRALLGVPFLQGSEAVRRGRHNSLSHLLQGEQHGQPGAAPTRNRGSEHWSGVAYLGMG